MNLTDKEILELNELCNAVVDETISDRQQSRLMHWLAVSEQARQFYVRAMTLSASLCTYASELQTEEAEPAPATRASATWGRRAWWWWFVPVAAAGCVVLVAWLGGWLRPGTGDSMAKAEEYVARLTGSKNCQWTGPAQALQPGDYVCRGQRLELAGGYAEITFDSGARVVLEGPASFEVNSAWDATLLQGTAKANAPLEAIGFRIASPAVEIVDLGTEFTMIADAGGAADVLVLKGEVEAARQGDNGERTIILRENESRRFAPSGVSEVSDRDRKFARFSQPTPLDTFFPATQYVHWSFDEPGSDVARADDFALPLKAYDARLTSVPQTPLSAIRTEGRWQRAWQFDGRRFARAAFPGLSSSLPHTVMFWVRVPPDAQLSQAYAMVAWGLNFSQYGLHPVHICWNRNPVEGPIGALRTDFLGGYAMGATPLRDGRWHHVAVVFVPGKDADSLAQVKQYVDGRLETSASTRGIRREIWVDAGEEGTAGVGDAVWLGCRLGSDRERRGRFHGDLDELVVANGALGPQEIVQLMKHNRPLRTELAAAGKVE